MPLAINILHLSWEIPDCFQPNKTLAVEALVRETGIYFNSKTLSFNRSIKSKGTKFIYGKSHVSIEYFGLPFGMFHLRYLKKLFGDIDNVFKEIKLVHGHKLTYEGVLCYYAKKKFGIPYVLTLRANTDFKLIKYLPQHRTLFRKVAEGAKKIFCLNPWSAKKLCKIFPGVKDRVVVLPNICGVEKFLQINNIKNLSEPLFKKDGELLIATAFNLNLYKMKGLDMILRLINRLSMPVKLLIIGGGDSWTVDSISKLIKRYGLQGKVHLLGHKNHQEIIEIYRECDLFLMPSKSESFGMAYLEALSCGLPVLQRKDVGLDGFFVGYPFYITADSENDFLSAIEGMHPEIDLLKLNIREFLSSKNFEKFLSPNIVSKYVSEIKGII